MLNLKAKGASGVKPTKFIAPQVMKRNRIFAAKFIKRHLQDDEIEFPISTTTSKLIEK